MKILHLWPEEPKQQNGFITCSTIIEAPGQERKTLWYKIPEGYQNYISKTCNPFIAGSLFLLMKTGVDVHVHGPVSTSLLRNLCEFQAAWVSMRPDLVNVAISADNELEDLANAQEDNAIMSFSGGVDSCFTALRHTNSKDFRFPRKLTTALMIQGFDIPLDDHKGFKSAADRSKRMLSSLGIELITASTNYRDVIGDWNHSHGAAIASCLSLFDGKFSEGLIAQTFTYGDIGSIFEGVNSLTDPLLSSRNFKIVSDGAAFKRSDKILAISDSPELLKDLRVCWEGPQKDRNCCNCEKCMRSILTFRALDLGLPPCFEHDISLQQIKTMRMGDRLRRNVRYKPLLPMAKAHGTQGAWTDTISKRLATERWREDSKLFQIYHRNRRRAKRLLARLKRKVKRKLNIFRSSG